MSPRLPSVVADDPPPPVMPRLVPGAVPASLRPRPSLPCCATCGDTGWVWDGDPATGVEVERDCPAGCPATWVDGPADSGTVDRVEAEAERLATVADVVADEGDGDVDGGEWWEEVA